ncbi:hypothetical protein M758_10G079700 [Ceratodon purpureus]|uniref:Uncharacterized protein n=1 Tax=Ceratodon purpureus TaxID=3225 RepID=A0A8T0GLJ4_CERPU|nr:hypothetical protein KC19_10G080900 [Ceratodon purpureus]KAG0603258.1 hypothetical protein M758_10G079700 [Ceratodon purpureus]
MPLQVRHHCTILLACYGSGAPDRGMMTFDEFTQPPKLVERGFIEKCKGRINHNIGTSQSPLILVTITI